MSRRGTLLTILGAFYVPLSFTTGIFGMTIEEIDSNKPKWYHVLAIALPLTVVTILIPLNFVSMWRNTLKASLRFEEAAKTRTGRTVLLSLEISMASLTVLFYVFTYKGAFGSIATWIYPIFLTLWACCVWLSGWVRGWHRFWATCLSIGNVIAGWILAIVRSTSDSQGPESLAVLVLSAVFVAVPFVLRFWPFLLRFWKRGYMKPTKKYR